MSILNSILTYIILVRPYLLGHPEDQVVPCPADQGCKSFNFLETSAITRVPFLFAFGFLIIILQ